LMRMWIDVDACDVSKYITSGIDWVKQGQPVIACNKASWQKQVKQTGVFRCVSVCFEDSNCLSTFQSLPGFDLQVHHPKQHLRTIFRSVLLEASFCPHWVTIWKTSQTLRGICEIQN
jgi:hypothetical protein